LNVCLQAGSEKPMSSGTDLAAQYRSTLVNSTPVVTHTAVRPWLHRSLILAKMKNDVVR
jgi:hypothetical protein